MKRLVCALAAVILVATLVSALWPRRGPQVASAGVVLMGTDVGGWTAAEIECLVDHLAGELGEDAADARYDPASQAVVPGYPGAQVARDATVRRVLQARPGSSVSPVIAAIPPEVTVWDFSAPAVYRGNPQRREVALVFNVAWGDRNLPGVLDVLEDHAVVATFSVMGVWAEKNPEHVLVLAEHGHELACHGYRDVHPSRLPADELRRDLEAVGDLLRMLGVPPPRVYTPHYGERTDDILAAADSAGLVTVFWSVDSLDWMYPEPGQIAARIGDLVHPGAIILLHPTPATAAGLDMALGDLIERGYRPVTLTRLLVGSAGRGGPMP